MDFNKALQFLSFIGIILLLIFRSKDNPINFPRYVLFYLLFVLYDLFGNYVLLDREFKIKYLFANQYIGAFNIMLIVENVVFSKLFYNKIIKYSKIILIFAFVVILIQEAINANFFVRTDLVNESRIVGGSESRLSSIYSWIGQNSSGFGFVPIFLLIVEYLKKNQKKILVWILIGIVFAFLTKARWIMVNALFVFVLLLVEHKDKVKQFFKYLLIIPILAFGTYLALNSVGINTEAIIKDRILESDKKDISKKSAGTRLLAIKVFDKVFWDNPILGRGNVKYGLGGDGKQDYKLKKALGGHSSQIHVGYLSLLYIYGIIGSFFFLGFLFLLLKRLYNEGKVTGIWAPFLGILGLAFANLTMVYFSLLEMGFIIVLVASRFYKQLYIMEKNEYT